jgi:hypothetical protein
MRLKEMRTIKHFIDEGALREIDEVLYQDITTFPNFEIYLIKSVSG